MRVGTPPIIAFAALEAALDVWDDVSIDDVRARSMELSNLFIAEVEERCPDLELVSPRSAEDRGSQVSFRFEHAWPTMQALIHRGVIGDFRAPDVMRFRDRAAVSRHRGHAPGGGNPGRNRGRETGGTGPGTRNGGR